MKTTSLAPDVTPRHPLSCRPPPHPWNHSYHTVLHPEGSLCYLPGSFAVSTHCTCTRCCIVDRWPFDKGKPCPGLAASSRWSPVTTKPHLVQPSWLTVEVSVTWMAALALILQQKGALAASQDCGSLLADSSPSTTPLIMLP